MVVLFITSCRFKITSCEDLRAETVTRYPGYQLFQMTIIRGRFQSSFFAGLSKLLPGAQE